MVPDAGFQRPLNVVPSRPSVRDQSIFPFEGRVSFARQAKALGLLDALTWFGARARTSQTKFRASL